MSRTKHLSACYVSNIFKKKKNIQMGVECGVILKPCSYPHEDAKNSLKEKKKKKKQ